MDGVERRLWSFSHRANSDILLIFPNWLFLRKIMKFPELLHMGGVGEMQISFHLAKSAHRFKKVDFDMVEGNSGNKLQITSSSLRK